MSRLPVRPSPIREQKKKLDRIIAAIRGGDNSANNNFGSDISKETRNIPVPIPVPIKYAESRRDSAVCIPRIDTIFATS